MEHIIDAIVYCAVFIMSLIPLTLEGIGLYTPNWVIDGNCSTGLFYRCCGNDTYNCHLNNDYPFKEVFVIQAISFGLLILMEIALVFCFLCAKHKALTFVPAAGHILTAVLMLNGLNLIKEKYPESLGYSYELSIVGAFLTWIEVFVFGFFVYIFMVSRNRKVECYCGTQELATKSCCVFGTLKESRKNMKYRSPFIADFADIKVKIIVGRMAEQEVDVIVSITCSNLKMNDGLGISQSLSQQARQYLQDECDLGYPNSIEQGDVAITIGHQLKCQKVFNGSLPSWNCKPSGIRLSENVLSCFISKCLDKAERRSFKSIAFPPLGTGFLKYPVQIAVKTMIEAIVNFKKERRSNFIKEVRVVINEESDDCTNIKKEFVDQLKRVEQAGDNGNGELKMILLRMCLGDVCVTKKHENYSHPPCKQCHKKVCFDHTEFDSVMAAGGDFEDREFIVYEGNQCYH